MIKMKCAYCELPEIRKRTIVENDLAFAFPTNIPITVGHTLVIPKRCVAKYGDLTKSEMAAIEALRVQVCASLVRAFSAKGFNFAWNEGKDFGQSVPHFHLHIVPRSSEDTGIVDYEPRKFLYRTGDREAIEEEELIKVSEVLRENI